MDELQSHIKTFKIKIEQETKTFEEWLKILGLGNIKVHVRIDIEKKTK